VKGVEAISRRDKDALLRTGLNRDWGDGRGLLTWKLRVSEKKTTEVKKEG